MSTEKLYQNDVYKRNCMAELVEVIDGKEDNGACSNCEKLLKFNRTVFFPEAGGQGCDTGTVCFEGGGSLGITHTSIIGDDIFHHVTASAWHQYVEYHGEPAPRTSARLEIDWQVRFDNMQRHAGEHILSGAFHRLYGGVNRGFHMGDDYMTVDIAFEDEFLEDEGRQRYTSVTSDMAEAVEFECNMIIQEDMKITTDYFKTHDEAARMPLRKKLVFDEDISVVTVGDIDQPKDCCPCCGTHPSTTGQIGLLKIYKIEANKGMTRIFFEAGRRAFVNYQVQYNEFEILKKELSAGTDDVIKKFLAFKEKNERTHRELTELKYRIRDIEAEKINSEITDSSEKVLVFHYNDISVDELFSLGKKLNISEGGLVVLISDPEVTAVLISSGDKESLHCGNLVKDLARPFGGKGGGKKESARAIFGDLNELDEFIERLATV